MRQISRRIMHDPPDDWLKTGWARDSQTRTRLVDSLICITCSLENNAFSVLHCVMVALHYSMFNTSIRDFFCPWNNRAWLYQAAASQPRVFAKLLVSNYFGRDGTWCWGKGGGGRGCFQMGIILDGRYRYRIIVSSHLNNHLRQEHTMFTSHQNPTPNWFIHMARRFMSIPLPESE